MNRQINCYHLKPNNLSILHQYSIPNKKYTEKLGVYIVQKGYNLGFFDLEHVFLLSTNKEGYVNGIINIADGNNRHAEIYLQDVAFYLNTVHAFGFAMYHNHPNNVIRASSDDLVSATDMEELGKEMNIRFYGSYILGQREFIKVGDKKSRLIEEL